LHGRRGATHPYRLDVDDFGGPVPTQAGHSGDEYIAVRRRGARLATRQASGEPGSGRLGETDRAPSAVAVLVERGTVGRREPDKVQVGAAGLEGDPPGRAWSTLTDSAIFSGPGRSWLQREGRRSSGGFPWMTADETTFPSLSLNQRMSGAAPVASCTV
jgi:hypothetical protein